jgi:hypothetical protein
VREIERERKELRQSAIAHRNYVIFSVRDIFFLPFHIRNSFPV